MIHTSHTNTSSSPDASVLKDHHHHIHTKECRHDDHSNTGPLSRQILTKDDLSRFLGSSTYEKYDSFIQKLNESIKNKPMSCSRHVSDLNQSLVRLLDTLSSWIDDIPPEPQTKSRFGNPSFQVWMDRLVLELPSLLSSFLKVSSLVNDHKPTTIQELAGYLAGSFGNRKRIDYGTGHESHFMAFLLCLEEIGILQPDDYTSLVFDVFWKYIKLMRRLQFTYWLEPAGSHGVWGLDDYHFLPFLFGSGQLFDHKYLRPKSIHNKEIIDEFANDYMYFSCIQFINSVKTASLRWHSPMLDDISGVKSWSKVNQGMFKMYKAEVMGKLPIMQHFLFGSLLPFEGAGAHLGSEEVDHSHVHAYGQQHPECCGIRIPSAIAAARSEMKRIPFD